LTYLVIAAYTAFVASALLIKKIDANHSSVLLDFINIKPRLIYLKQVFSAPLTHNLTQLAQPVSTVDTGMS